VGIFHHRVAIRSIAITAVPLLLTAALGIANRSTAPLVERSASAQVEIPDAAPILARTRYDEMIRTYAGRYGVDPALVKAVIQAESGFRSRVRSNRGARGLMQIMPGTGRAYGVRNLYDPKQNLRAGIRHLRYLLDRHDNDPTLALAAYNAGARAVKTYGGVPPFAETRGYVAKVLRYHRRYQTASVKTAVPRS
jgi:soluble lytic murein transglycosylase-like protein